MIWIYYQYKLDHGLSVGSALRDVGIVGLERQSCVEYEEEGGICAVRYPASNVVIEIFEIVRDGSGFHEGICCLGCHVSHFNDPI